jgi:hypothetical protein
MLAEQSTLTEGVGVSARNCTLVFAQWRCTMAPGGARNRDADALALGPAWKTAPCSVCSLASRNLNCSARLRIVASVAASRLVQRLPQRLSVIANCVLCNSLSRKRCGLWTARASHGCTQGAGVLGPSVIGLPPVGQSFGTDLHPTTGPVGCSRYFSPGRAYKCCLKNRLSSALL